MIFLKFTILFLLISISLVGCFSNERMNELMYDGLQTSQHFKTMQNPGDKSNFDKDVSYKEYKKNLQNTKF